MGASPDQCAVVEDTPSGVRAGVAAGMRVLGYAPDGNGPALRAVGAEPLRSLDELPCLLHITDPSQ